MHSKVHTDSLTVCGKSSARALLPARNTLQSQLPLIPTKWYTFVMITLRSNNGWDRVTSVDTRCQQEMWCGHMHTINLECPLHVFLSYVSCPTSNWRADAHGCCCAEESVCNIPGVATALGPQTFQLWWPECIH